MGASFTNHTGIIDFNGHSYFFYHNGALQKGGSVPSNGDGYHRSVCLEEFKYNSDGSFPTIPPTTAGPQAIANLNPYVQTEAETIAWESGVQTEVTNDAGGGMDVTAINNGDYIKIRSVDFGAGATSFDARVASNASGGNIELHLDSLTGTAIGTCAVSGTGGAQTWVTKTCSVNSTTGIHDLFLKFTGSGSGNLFNFNWWRFGGPGAIVDSDGGSTGDGPSDARVEAGSTGGASGGTSGAGGAFGGSGGMAGNVGGAAGSGQSAGGQNGAVGGAPGSSAGTGGGQSGGHAGGSANGPATGCSCQTAPGRGGTALVFLLLLLPALLRGRSVRGGNRNRRGARWSRGDCWSISR
jgi:hypothetical protein